MEVTVFHFRGMPKSPGISKNRHKKSRRQRNLGKPQPSSSQAKSSAAPGAASRPHHQISQATRLLVLSFPKEEKQAQESSLLRPCSHTADQELPARNESPGDATSLNRLSSQSELSSALTHSRLASTGWHFPRVALGTRLWSATTTDLHGHMGDRSFSFFCSAGFGEDHVSRASYYPLLTPSTSTSTRL